MALQILQIDHVEMFVPNREDAAQWYHDVLGLDVVEEFRFWAAGDGGPLMISTPEAGTKLALFEGEPQASRPTVGFHRVAFRVDGASFLAFLDRIEELGLTDRKGAPVTRADAFDHAKSYSIYFSDPYGHNLEITTYDHEHVRTAFS